MDAESMQAQSDEALGREALEAIRPRLRDIPAAQVETPNVDVEAAGLAIVAFAALLREEHIRAAFGRVHEVDFDHRQLDDLETLARGARYAHTLDGAARDVQPGKALVTAGLVAQATEVRGRMLRVLAYWLEEEDPEVKRALAAIRAGQGHRDRARDLNRLAALYREHAAALQHDARHYDAGDADLADRLAEQTFDALGLGPAGRSDSADVLARAWTLLRRTHDDVAATGRWLFRNTDTAALFPSVYALVRPAPHAHAEPAKPAPAPAAP